jgi:hypothetical protein
MGRGDRPVRSPPDPARSGYIGGDRALRVTGPHARKYALPKLPTSIPPAPIVRKMSGPLAFSSVSRTRHARAARRPRAGGQAVGVTGHQGKGTEGVGSGHEDLNAVEA